MRAITLIISGLLIFMWGCDDKSSGSMLCGNGSLDSEESCDGTNLNGTTCGDFGFFEGELTCNKECAVDSSGCFGVCGDGLLNGDEQCDATKLGGATCESLGYNGGTLACSESCRFDNTGCDIPCLMDLEEKGIVFELANMSVEHPDELDHLDCEVVDAIYLYPPVNNITWRTSSTEGGALLVACKTAQAIEKMCHLLEERGATEFTHMGTYNCRVISGTETLSQHALGLAIDLAGFTLANSTTYTVLDDWEDNVANPQTPGGIWLKEFADTMFDRGIWNIMLTPNYNDLHDNHFHVDLTEGASFFEK
jgi:Extensin-like protein C-terminus